MCAGEAGHDHCFVSRGKRLLSVATHKKNVVVRPFFFFQGDSGGPLTCGEGDQLVICGIVSWALECALPGYPGVNTQVSYYVDWILDNA